MSTIRRLGPKLVFCGIICGLFLIGWATRYSIAQGRTQDAPPPTALGSTSKETPPQVKPETVKAEPAPALPGPLNAEAVEPPSVKEIPSPEPLPISTSAPAPPPVVVGPDHSPIELDDPEKVATEFFEQNQKLAEAQLKALKEEAQKLRVRLTKVEAGIKRWDRLLIALGQSQATAAVEKAGDERPASTTDATPPAAANSESRPGSVLSGSEVPPTLKPVAPPGDLVPR
jgi:hypothetical protein